MLTGAHPSVVAFAALIADQVRAGEVPGAHSFELLGTIQKAIVQNF